MFEIFSKGYLSVEFEDDLLKVLKKIHILEKEIYTPDMKEQKSYVLLLRQIFEGVKIRVGEVLRDDGRISEEDIRKLPKAPKENYKGTLINVLVKKKQPLEGKKATGTTDPLIWYLSQTDPSYSFLLCESYYKILCDTFWGKSSQIVHGKTPTQYCLPILVNMLMDILTWFHDFMNRNSNK